jgi:hypothetical protein
MEIIISSSQKEMLKLILKYFNNNAELIFYFHKVIHMM